MPSLISHPADTKELAAGGWVSENPLVDQSSEKDRNDDRGKAQGGREKERCIMGYEIKYSMSALFWSPSPSSTPRVSSLEGGGGEGG